MAAFKQHITVSSLLGVGYAAALGNLGVEWTHACLAGGLCAVSGMLPDLDSGTGKPARELFGFTAAVAPLLLQQRLRNAGFAPETLILFMGACYLLIRFGASWLFKRLTVHRGMFHSLPAALIAAEVVYLAHACPYPYGRLVLAGGVLLGFLSHLVLDELYSVDIDGLTVRLNRAAGSAMKLVSQDVPATLITWVALGALSYLVGIQQGYFPAIHFTVRYPAPQSAGR